MSSCGGPVTSAIFNRRVAFRLALATFVALAFNYILYSHGALASHPSRYAAVRENDQGTLYTGVKGDMWFGDPYPNPPDPGFSNGTIWTANYNYCDGNSWVETGWYEGYRDHAYGRYYKFIYKVPGTNNCNYYEVPGIFGTPAVGSTENFRLELCLSGCSSTSEYRWYWQNLWTASVKTGWTYAEDVTAGGEVGGHQTNIGMQGAISNLRYRKSLTWYTWTESTTDESGCDTGYTLNWTGSDDINFYNGSGGC